MLTLNMVVAVSALCLVAGDSIVPIGPTVRSEPSNSTTTPIPTTPTKPTNGTTTTTSTSQPNTTTTATTPTTTSPTTTTSTPTTTSPTTPTTTVTPGPNTTTTTSTTAKPTTPPTPVDPQRGKWMANSTNTTCLVLEAAIQIVVPYKDGNDTKTFKVNVPPSANVQGVCGADVENITLLFLDSDIVSFGFRKTNDSKYDLEMIGVTLKASIPGKNDSQFVVLQHIKNEFTTPLSNSYKCAKEQSLKLTAVMPDTYVGELRISQLQVQAFRKGNNTNFDEALDCAGSETPDVVPIAVGCALVILVIVVLVTYLIGRRRSQARGYLSM